MHQSHARVANIVVGIVLKVIGEGVDQRAGVIAMSWMHHQPCRFVHHQQLVVLINYIKWYVFGNNLVFIARTVHHYAYVVAGFYAIVRLHRAAVHSDAFCFGSLLNSVARGVGNARNEKFIDSEQHLPLIYLDVVVLPKVTTVLAVVGLYLEIDIFRDVIIVVVE